MHDHDVFDLNFSLACKDYFYLINRNYPERGTLKLIGDRYKLSGDQRTILYRGISSSADSASRRSRLFKWTGGEELLIDGYNVLFTILNYRLGKIMFISTDSILRDAGSLHGRMKEDTLFLDCADILLKYLAGNGPESVKFFFDSPVSHSERHAFEISRKMDHYAVKGGCLVVRSADHELKKFKEGIIATSDTAIIDSSAIVVTDLPKLVLEKAFNPVFFDLKSIVPDA
jgi:hypothetical protein